MQEKISRKALIIIKITDMKTFQEVPDIKRLIIYLPFLQEGLEYAKKKNLKEIYITTQIETNESCLNSDVILDINLITHYKFIESIIISDLWGIFKDNICLNQLSKLHNLKKIEINVDSIFTIDFSLFKKLTHIKYYDSKLILGLQSLNSLTSAVIYNLKSTDLNELNKNKNLKYLTLWDCKNQNINGLSELKCLEEIEIVRSKKLTNINGLKNSRELKILGIYQCPQLEDISIISYLKELKELHLKKNKLITNLNQIIPNNIEFLSVDKIENLYFISKMNSLRLINFENVTNNDLSPLYSNSSLEGASFINKKNYNYTRKEIELFFTNKKATQ